MFLKSKICNLEKEIHIFSSKFNRFKWVVKFLTNKVPPISKLAKGAICALIKLGLKTWTTSNKDDFMHKKLTLKAQISHLPYSNLWKTAISLVQINLMIKSSKSCIHNQKTLWPTRIKFNKIILYKIFFVKSWLKSLENLLPCLSSYYVHCITLYYA